jgi:hypothetical protein
MSLDILINVSICMVCMWTPNAANSRGIVIIRSRLRVDSADRTRLLLRTREHTR